MNRKGIFSLVIVFWIIATATTVLAAENSAETITKTQEYVSSDRDKDASFDEILQENETYYRLSHVTYDILQTEEITDEKHLTIQEKEDSPIWTGKEPVPEETILKDGITYTLENVQTQEALLTGRTAEISDTITAMDYQISDNATVSYIDPVTGESLSFQIPLSDKSKIGERWEPFSMPVTFDHYDSAYFILGDQIIPKNDQSPDLQGHESLLLSSQGYDPADFRIDTITYEGEPYQQNGVLYRNAIATGTRYREIYECTYHSVVSLPDLPAYFYTYTYGADVPYTAGHNYTIQATALYQYDPDLNDTGLSLSQILFLSVGVLLLIVLLVTLLIIFLRKSKEKKNARNS